MTNTQSPIKLRELIEETQKLDVMSTFIIDEENNRVVKFNKYFDATQVEKLVLEFFEDMQYAVQNKYDFFNNEEQFIKYELLLVIKYFSHFKDEIGNTFEEKIQAMEALMRLGLYDVFFDEIFDQNQVLFVIDKINNVAEKAIVTSEQMSKTEELKVKTK